MVGDWLDILFIHNNGGLFGLFQNQVAIFAAVSLVVIGFLVWYEVQAGWRHWPLSLALTLLLGGAVGNLVDRVRLGYVVDFVDMGIGGWRWYTYNLADAAISTAIVILLALSFLWPAALGMGDEHDARPAGHRGPETASPGGPETDRGEQEPRA